MEFLETLTALLFAWGIYGLIVASFTESFISPILPDLILIPLALAQPENAVYYAAAAVAASVAGGFVGYGIGSKIGTAAAQRMIPAKYADTIHKQVRQNAALAIFLAALSPIPYKFVSITAGALKIRFDIFIIASFVGRSKRFMVEGLLIYYFGERALALINDYSNYFMIGLLALTIITIIVYMLVKKYKKNGATALD